VKHYDMKTADGVPYRVQLDDAEAEKLGVLRRRGGEQDKRGREEDKRGPRKADEAVSRETVEVAETKRPGAARRRSDG
jgi:hypothetical protein